MFCRKTFRSKIEKNDYKTLRVILATIFYYVATMSQLIKGPPSFSDRGIQKHISNQSRIHVVVFNQKKGNAVHFRGSVVWNNLLAEIKSSNLFSKCKTRSERY